MGVEVGGVNTSVGAAAADDGDGLAKESGEGLLDGELHGGQIGLGLPATVVGAVVCQMYEVSHFEVVTFGWGRGAEPTRLLEVSDLTS